MPAMGVTWVPRVTSSPCLLPPTGAQHVSTPGGSRQKAQGWPCSLACDDPGGLGDPSEQPEGREAARTGLEAPQRTTGLAINLILLSSCLLEFYENLLGSDRRGQSNQES